MKCWHPECTGVHDNNRYHELCPRSLDMKRDRDARWYANDLHALRKNVRERMRYRERVGF